MRVRPPAREFAPASRGLRDRQTVPQNEGRRVSGHGRAPPPEGGYARRAVPQARGTTISSTDSETIDATVENRIVREVTCGSRR
ncbi:hypothetical protein Bpla01_54120 [Burkholderia plantarii]|nr:hypothetical protein Bpla01_54120 [Burkholderia plantarii]